MLPTPVTLTHRAPARSLALIRLAIVPVAAGTALLIAWKLGYFRLDHRQRLVDVVHGLQQVRATEVVFVALDAMVLALVLPATIPSVVGGALFGWWKGALLAWLGALLGTTLSHFLARRIARKPVKRLFGEHRLLRELRDRDSVLALLRLRILPLAPFATLDYVCGIAGVSLRRLLVATMIGYLPSVIAYTYVGSAIMRGIAAGNDASHRALWVAGIVTAAMLLASAVPALVHRLRR